jgi:hypothetical protein
MPLRKPDDTHDDGDDAVTQPFPPEAYQYEAELTPEKVARVQAKADVVLKQEDWVVIDGVDKPKP